MSRPHYEAANSQGLPYIRLAKIVGELPNSDDRLRALDSATQQVARLLNSVATRRIPFGAPVFVAFGLTRPQAKNHAQATLLLTRGQDLSLDFCPEYN